MTIKLYCIHDRVAGEYGPIFQAVNDGVANRQLVHYTREAAEKDDYRLYSLGEYDTHTGELRTKAPEMVVANGK